MHGCNVCPMRQQGGTALVHESSDDYSRDTNEKAMLQSGFTISHVLMLLPTIYSSEYSSLQKFLTAPAVQLYAFTPWASYHIREIVGCASALNAGNVFPTAAG